ncbi:MAG: class I SAM-dependent methyltransferase [bacterium]|nr:class I SAM-dependent methyltransferase [bacterium]
MPHPFPPGMTITPERMREHYELEKELSNRLRTASKAERAALYSAVYDEYHRRAADDARVARKDDLQLQAWVAGRQVRLLKPFLTADKVYLEVGAGDCAVTLAVAPHVRQAYALEVSAVISADVNRPANFELLLSQGARIPLPDSSVDVVYSNQVIEHFHLEDLPDHLNEILRVLRPGGLYITITPNRIAGPYDGSRYYDDVATGFHLREYTISELGQRFRRAGFRRAIQLTGVRGVYLHTPSWLFWPLERLLLALPMKLRHRIIHWNLMDILINIRLVGCK